MTVIQTLTLTAGMSVSPPWQGEQNPRVRGVVQDRITAVSDADVPGSVTDQFRPDSAMRIELRPFHDSDYTVAATAAASSSDTVIQLSLGDAASLQPYDFMVNTRTSETVRVSSISGTAATVLRARHSTAAAINSGDTFTVLCGDVNDSGGDYATSRAEVYADLPSPTTTAPALWPNPPGAVRWFHWAAYVPHGFAAANDGKWLTVFQLKGLYGGGPPLGMEIQRTNWRFAGTRGNGWTDATGTHAPVFADNGVLGNYNAGQWTDFIVGVHLSPDPAVGWVEVWMNRQVVIPKMALSTMDTVNNNGIDPDPLYIKQGIYRDDAWATTAVLYYGPLTIADSSLDFGVASSPSPNSNSPALGEYWGVVAS